MEGINEIEKDIKFYEKEAATEIKRRLELQKELDLCEARINLFEEFVTSLRKLNGEF